MAQPRRHHFVQAEHIRQFVNENGTVWVYSKDGKAFEVSPEAIFWKKDLNSYETADGLNTDFETFVTDFENETFPAVSKTIKNRSVSADDIFLLTGYLALSQIRNPSLQVGIIEHHKQVLNTTTKLEERFGDKLQDIPPFPGQEGKSLSQLIEEGFIEFQVNNAVYLDRVVRMTEQTHRLFCDAYRWNLVISPLGRVVISDHPLTFVHPGRDPGAYGLVPGGTNCEVAFPLSKNLYLVGLWEREFEAVKSEDLVDELNKRQALFANRHIATGQRKNSWSELVLRHRNSGFQTKADTLDFGQGAYHILRGSVFPLGGRPPPKGKKPLETLKPLFPRKAE